MPHSEPGFARNAAEATETGEKEKGEEKMNANFNGIARIALCLAVIALALPACASAEGRLNANVPFAFTVGQHQLPAGPYTLTIDYIHYMVKLQNQDTAAAVFFLTSRKEASKMNVKGYLQFNRYGSEHFLSQIWLGGDNRGCETRPSWREKELRASMDRQTVNLGIVASKAK
jgi:hypothetical protein